NKRKNGQRFQMRGITRRAKEGRQIDPRVRAWFYSESWAELENVLRVSALALLRNVAIARLQTDLQSLPANGVRGRRRKTDFPLAIPTNGLVKEEVQANSMYLPISC